VNASQSDTGLAGECIAAMFRGVRTVEAEAGGVLVAQWRSIFFEK
jgi:hypothetical protein